MRTTTIRIEEIESYTFMPEVKSELELPKRARIYIYMKSKEAHSFSGESAEQANEMLSGCFLTERAILVVED